MFDSHSFPFNTNYITFAWPLGMKTSFSQTNLPNSWLTALLLHQIKDDWGKINNKITSQELNSVRGSLISAFKHYRKEMKHVIRTIDVIKLDLCCKAAVSQH